MIVYDLDGVLRWMAGPERNFIDAKYWEEPMPNGQSVVEFYSSEPHKLNYCPVTPYYPVIIKDRMRDTPTILTLQLESWIPYTEKWIHVYIPQAKVIYVKSSQEKIDYINSFKDMYLVEDCPHMPDMSKIIMVDHDYNKHVKDCFCRVNSPEELEYIQEALK